MACVLDGLLLQNRMETKEVFFSFAERVEMKGDSLHPRPFTPQRIVSSRLAIKAYTS